MADTFLGGEDFDQAIVEHLAGQFQKKENMDLRTDKLALQRLKEAAEKAKIELSSAQTTEGEPSLHHRSDGRRAAPPRCIWSRRSAAPTWEKMVGDLIKRTLEPCKKALADAGVSKDDIDEVIMVGGMTRMPRVREVVEEFFGAKPHTGVNPDEVVAMGRRDPGGRAAGRREGRAAARRDAFVAWHRDAGRRVHPG